MRSRFRFRLTSDTSGLILEGLDCDVDGFLAVLHACAAVDAEEEAGDDAALGLRQVETGDQL